MGFVVVCLMYNQVRPVPVVTSINISQCQRSAARNNKNGVVRAAQAQAQARVQGDRGRPAERESKACLWLPISWMWHRESCEQKKIIDYIVLIVVSGGLIKCVHTRAWDPTPERRPGTDDALHTTLHSPWCCGQRETEREREGWGSDLHNKKKK